MGARDAVAPYIWVTCEQIYFYLFSYMQKKKGKKRSKMSRGALERLLYTAQDIHVGTVEINTCNVHVIDPMRVNFIENYVPIARQLRRENFLS